MKKLLLALPFLVLLSCGQSKKENTGGNVDGGNGNTGSIDQKTTTQTEPAVTSSNTSFVVEGKEVKTSGSLMVTKDKKNIKPGVDYLVMLTASGSGENTESLTLNFLIGLQAGTYPIVGWSFNRGPSEGGELYGKLLGGAPAPTKYSVTISECRDLGDNGMGGHKWSISGTVDEVVIPAMGIMLLDKTKNHPKEIKLEKISFTNLTFDDNWEEMLEKGMEMIKKEK